MNAEAALSFALNSEVQPIPASCPDPPLIVEVAGAGPYVSRERRYGYSRAMPTYAVKEAADLLGVSDDTIRRWIDSGRLTAAGRTGRSGRVVVDGAALAAFAQQLAAEAPSPVPRPVVSESARNRFTGLVTRVIRDTVMAQVEIQAGPHRFVSLMSREAADDLGLEPGVLAIAAVKSTNVVVEVPGPNRMESR
jgi:molybdopterin-binding protein